MLLLGADFCAPDDKIDEFLTAEKAFPEVVPLSFDDDQRHLIFGIGLLIGFRKRR